MMELDAQGHYPIVDLPTTLEPEVEVMGSKRKFWVRLPDQRRALFKEPRGEAGDDWAEKVVCELARLLGLPHAEVALARWGTRPGILSHSVLASGEVLVHGNEILRERVPRYPADLAEHRGYYRNTKHTVQEVLRANSVPELQLPAR